MVDWLLPIRQVFWPVTLIAVGATRRVRCPAMTTRNYRPGLGRLVAGLLLVVLGVLWLIEEFTDLDLPWAALLAGILIVIGVVLMFVSSEGTHGGLVALGTVLTAIVIASAALDVLVEVPFTGGVGDNDLTPSTLEPEYRWAVGSMTIDLEAAVFDGSTVEMSVGLGELVVLVPAGVDVVVEATAGIGEVVVFAANRSGISPELDFALPPGTEPRLHIIARVGIGKVEVRRG